MSNASKECPKGKTYLPKGDKRGDYHVVEKCKFCGEVREFDCIYA